MPTLGSTLSALALPALALLALAACNRAPTPATTAATPVPAEPATVVATAAIADANLVARGEYLVRIAGCNECHTPGYMDQQGNVDKTQWLTGNVLGFSGPWGTTYPTNLRLKSTDMDEAAWLQYTADLHTRPVMPDYNVRAMTEDDRRAIYRFARSLGAAGQPAPAYLPPGQKPAPPYMELVLPPAPAPQAPPAS